MSGDGLLIAVAIISCAAFICLLFALHPPYLNSLESCSDKSDTGTCCKSKCPEYTYDELQEMMERLKPTPVLGFNKGTSDLDLRCPFNIGRPAVFELENESDRAFAIQSVEGKTVDIPFIVRMENESVTASFGNVGWALCIEETIEMKDIQLLSHYYHRFDIEHLSIAYRCYEMPGILCGSSYYRGIMSFTFSDKISKQVTVSGVLVDKSLVPIHGTISEGYSIITIDSDNMPVYIDSGMSDIYFDIFTLASADENWYETEVEYNG